MRKMTMSNWTIEDDKLVTLAKSVRSRIGAASGAAVREETGRTYANAEVSTEFLNLSAIELTVGQAIASGAEGIEAVVLCTEGELSVADQKIITDFAGDSTPIYLVNMRGDRTN